jgi:phenylacetic acid degradation protein
VPSKTASKGKALVKVYAVEGVIPVVDPTAFVHPNAALIGDVVIGAGCYIGPFASLRGDIGQIRVGDGANVQDHCVMHCFPTEACIVEEWAHIGHGTVMHGATVRAHALVGMNSVLMDGCEIGAQAFVAAMSFVPAAFRVPERSLVAGIPAKVRREVSDDEIAWKKRGTAEYQSIAQRCLKTLELVDALPTLDEDRPSLQVEPHRPLHVMLPKSKT